jgi:hypothetical protein
MEELLVKVPAPFSGIEDLGFSARYPAQTLEEPLRDVTLFVEGPADPMERLYDRLRLFAEKDHLLGAGDGGGDDELYAWTAPIRLSDQVCVISFRDRSLTATPDALAPAGQLVRAHLWNLIRPLAFTFLRDCVRLGGLRLAERILFVLDPGRPPLVDLELERAAIVPENGTMLLYGF